MALWLQLTVPVQFARKKRHSRHASGTPRLTVGAILTPLALVSSSPAFCPLLGRPFAGPPATARRIPHGSPKSGQLAIIAAMSSARRSLGLIAAVCLSAGPVARSAAVVYKARLAPVPMDIAMQSTVAGSGSVQAVLTGAKLEVTGTFEGLKSPATVARIHKSPARGVRGPALLTLGVSPAAAQSGTISGTFDLTPAQMADLEKGRLYVQLHSEKAPDGNLWGWLLPQEGKR
jgi:CHRD domain